MPKSWTDSSEDYAVLARDVCDVIRLTSKDGRFWRVTAWTLGKSAKTRSVFAFAALPVV